MREFALVFLCFITASAHAQAPAPSAWQPPLREGRAAFEAERWADAATALMRAWRQLADQDRPERHSFACELGAASIRAGEPGLSYVGDGLASGERDDRARCAILAGDALLARQRLPEAAALYLHARADGGHVESRLASLPPPVRRAAEQLFEQLRRAPVRAAVGPRNGVEAIVERLEHVVWAARPTRSATCYPEPGWSSRRRGVVSCRYHDAPAATFPFMRGYPVESFVWERTRRGLSVVASFGAGVAWDCEDGHGYQTARFERLTRARNGIDGYLLSVEETWESVPIGDDYGGASRTLVYACARSSGTCARVEEDAARCLYGEAGPTRCAHDYEGTAMVRDGRLTIRIDRGELPLALQTPIDLSAITTQPARPERRSMNGCRVEVRDPSDSPLNVRASPAGRAPVVGTLDDGTVVRVGGREGRAWVRLEAPVRGYVWANNLRRVCGSQ